VKDEIPMSHCAAIHQHVTDDPKAQRTDRDGHGGADADKANRALFQILPIESNDNAHCDQ
jgi:hypothetical protein